MMNVLSKNRLDAQEENSEKDEAYVCLGCL